MEYGGKITSLSKSISWMLDEVKCNKKRCRCVAQRAKALEELVQSISTSASVSRALQDLYLTLNAAHELVKDCTKTRVPLNPLKLKRDFKSVNERLNNTFQVQRVTGIGNDHRLFVTVMSPAGVLLHSKNDVTGQMSFQTRLTGFYQMCFRNRNNQFGSTRVFLNFGVVYKCFEGAEEEERELNSTLASIEDSVQKLQSHIFHMGRHYNFARMRKGKDQHLLMSNRTYLTWWSAAQSLAIVLSACLQILIIKRLFNADSTRPRC